MEEEQNKEKGTSIDVSNLANFGNKKESDEQATEENVAPEEVKEEAEQKSETSEEEPKQEEATEEQEKEEPVEKKEEPVKDKPKDDEEDDEISIDFSKITNIFKKKEKTPKEKEEAPPKGDEDEEISFDFSSVKNFFKPKEKKKDAVASADDEVAVDWHTIKNFFVKYRMVFLILIPLIFSIFLRVQPAYLPITDEWAESSVMSNMQNQVSSQINQQYPNLPAENKDALVSNEMQRVLAEQKTEIDQQIEATSNYFKSRLQDDTGQTYLLAIDPYFWLRHTENVIKNGHPGDTIKDGEPYDTYMYAPKGRTLLPDMFHAYFEAYFYKFINIFSPDVTPKNTTFFVPVLLSALCVIPAFFITRRVGGDIGGFFAAVLIAVHPAFISRTAAGFADTDAYNILFPLLITWMFLEAFESSDIKKKVIFSGIAGLLTGLFSLTWGGWWYILDFLVLSSIACLVYFVLVKRGEILKKGIASLINDKTVRDTVLLIILYIAFSAFFTMITAGPQHFMGAFQGPQGFSEMKVVAVKSIWPNVFTTVAEQNEASLGQVISSMGGNFLFLLSLIGITLTMTSKKKKNLWFVAASVLWYSVILMSKPQDLELFLILTSIPIVIRFLLAIKNREQDIDMRYSLLLILWMLSTTYASVKGVRFTLLLVPAFSIGFGLFVGMVYNLFSTWTSKELKVEPWVTKVIAICVLLMLLLNPIRAGYGTAKQEIPSMNDAWFDSLDKINQEAEPDAIINSWWDFGHWFKEIGNRAVTFDGASQDSQQLHWIGKSLFTDDEQMAVGILRMVDCSGDEGFTGSYEVLMNIFTSNEIREINDELKTVNLINKIIVENKTEAANILRQEGFMDNQVAEILETTHCQPPENYYITSEDMIRKSGVWAHFGSWDFEKAAMFNKVISKDSVEGKQILMDDFGLTEEDADTIFYEIQTEEANQWISTWPSYASDLVGCSVSGNTVECGNGLSVDLTDYSAVLKTQQGVLTPTSLSYANESGFYVKEFEDPQVPYAAALVPNGKNSYASILMDPLLAGSMFTRLFYYRGHGLKHFNQFTYQRSVFGGQVFVWKVDWEGNEQIILDEFKPITTVIIGNEVEIDYIGWFENGSVFDSSIVGWQLENVTNETTFENKTSAPFSFTVGERQVIPGFEEGALGMNITQEKVIEVPPEKGYGTDPSRHPMGNKTLFFRIRVESIK